MKQRFIVMLSTLAVLAFGAYGFFGEGALVGFTASAQSNQTKQEAQAPTPAEEQAGLLPTEENTIQIVERYGPSVVAVYVEVRGQQIDPFADIPEQFQPFFRDFNLEAPRVRRGSGSGFVIDDAGHIVTNFHVVASTLDLTSGTTDLLEGAKVSVSFPSAPEDKLPARVIGANPDYDLALLELENPENIPQGVMPIPIADSDDVQVGQKTIAIGNPFGFQSTVTTGIVSAIEREGSSVVGIEIPYIQTDAAINPGNSGGPLLNSRGEVIGINTAIISPSGAFAGIGFAVPSDLLQESLAELKEGGISGLAGALRNPNRPLIGITVPFGVADYPDAVRESIELPDHGVVITAVSPGSPADEAGLQAPELTVNAEGREWPVGGDIVLAVEGEPVEGTRDIQRRVLEFEAGDTIELSVWRDGEERTVEVTLTSMSEMQEENGNGENGGENNGSSEEN